LNQNEIQKIRKLIEDKHSTVWFDSLAGDDVFELPSVADSHGRNILFINASDYELTLKLKGRETCNGFTTSPVITEKGGWWRLISTESNTDWLGITDGKSTIYYVESETVDSGLSVDGTWDDVEGMELLDGIYGQFLIEAFGVQYARRDGGRSSIYVQFGIGSISGDNAPNIAYNYRSGNANTTATVYVHTNERHINNAKYISDGSTIYMKACTGDVYDLHYMYGETGAPMYIKAKRIY